MLSYLLMSGLSYLSVKYITENWQGAWKIIPGVFVACLTAWLAGGLISLFITSFFAEIDQHSVPVFFARGFWWASIGMLVGIYRGRKARGKD